MSQSDTTEAAAIREELTDRWPDLTAQEQSRMKGLSGDLWALTNMTNQRPVLARTERDEWMSDVLTHWSKRNGMRH
jgi:hypothetical protein